MIYRSKYRLQWATQHVQCSVFKIGFGIICQIVSPLPFPICTRMFIYKLRSRLSYTISLYYLFTCGATSAWGPLGEPLPSPSEEEGATGGSAVFFRDFFRILSAGGFTSSLCLASVLTSSLTLGAGDSESSLESRWWTGFHGGGSQEPTSPTASILKHGKGQFEDWARTHFLQGINA